MKKTIILLRLSYWIGIILDAFVAVNLTSMRYFDIPSDTNIINHINNNYNLIYSLGQSAALMWGWTALLLWADRKPLERKGVLLLTVFPVVLGLLGNVLHIISKSYAPFSRVCLNVVIELFLILLFSYSYIRAKFFEKNVTDN